MATVLVKGGADPSIADYDGYTALTIAAFFPNDLDPTVFRALLSVHEDEDSLNAALLTVLGRQKGSVALADVVQFLLDAGASPNQPDPRGDTALWRAVFSAKGHNDGTSTDAIVSLLVSAHAAAGTKRDAVNSKNETAYEWAKDFDDPESTLKLLQADSASSVLRDKSF